MGQMTALEEVLPSSDKYKCIRKKDIKSYF